MKLKEKKRRKNKKRYEERREKDGKNLKIRYSQMCAAKQNICE